MITMECKEVCIPGEVQVLGLEKNFFLCFKAVSKDLFVLCRLFICLRSWCDGEKKKSESRERK